LRNLQKNDTPFRENIIRSSKNNFSRVILALDLQGDSSSKLLRNAKNLVDRTSPYICAVKLGRPTILNLGVERTRALIKASHGNNLPCIIDDKLGDIDETNSAISRAYFDMGFDGIIVNPIAGWKGGLEPVFKIAHRQGKGIIVLVYMSHPGASDDFGQFVLRNRRGRPTRQYEIFAERADEWGADGAVVGATRPEIVKRVRAKLSDKVRIYSPGIGTQGGKVIQASRAGSDFFIIGRSITRASDPERAAHNFARQSMTEP
jgi:orotidine-5'-phosphate decarboxylase